MDRPTYSRHPEHDVRITSAKNAITALLPLDLYPAHKRELLSICLWKITEADGKKKVRYWSEGAINSQNSKLHHEHVHERRELIQRLLNGENIEIVLTDAVACMVTEQEHHILSKSAEKGWQRYKHSNIKVYDALTQKWPEFF